MEAQTEPADGNRQLSPPQQYAWLAVLYDADVSDGNPWSFGACAALAATLVADSNVHFDYFPVSYAGPGAAERLRAAFAEVGRHQAVQPYDAMLIIGGPAIEADIRVVHEVLAPHIAVAPMQVLTAIGSDDAGTILGDTASHVFTDPAVLLGFVAAKVQATRPPAMELIDRMRSLGLFLLAEHEVETKIFMQSTLKPVLTRQWQAHAGRSAGLDLQLQRAVQAVSVRLVRDRAELDELHGRIGAEHARLLQTAQATPPDPTPHIARVRVALLASYLCIIAFLWWFTTPANLVFYGGCALVLLSAAYVTFSNRIIDAAGSPAPPPFRKREPTQESPHD